MTLTRHTMVVQLTPAELWKGLINKAEDPVPYLPEITACTVLERYPNGLLREIQVRNGKRQRELATFEPMRRITFAQLTDPLLAEIVNEIGTDQVGRTTFTLYVTLSPAGLERAAREPGFSAKIDEFFGGTVGQIVETLHRHAAVLAAATAADD